MLGAAHHSAVCVGSGCAHFDCDIKAVEMQISARNQFLRAIFDSVTNLCKNNDKVV